MHIRPFEPGDVEAVMALQAAEGWPSLSTDRDHTLGALAAPGVVALVATGAAGRVTGFAMALTDRRTTTYLANLVVAEDVRGMGAGRALIDAVFEATGAERMDLLSEEVSEGFYARLPHRRMPGFRLYSRAAVERYEREQRDS